MTPPGAIALVLLACAASLGLAGVSVRGQESFAQPLVPADMYFGLGTFAFAGALACGLWALVQSKYRS